MTTSELGRRCDAIYEAKLKDRLEKTNMDDFVAIEPESGDYFLGRSITEVARAAESAYPDRRGFILRVGHAAAIDLRGHLEVIGRVDENSLRDE
jgi:hypothetical protein